MTSRSPTKSFTVLPIHVSDCFAGLSRHFLLDLWTKMGLDESAVRSREEDFRAILVSTIKDMRAEEEHRLTDLVNRIETHAKERNRLAKELGSHLSDPDPDIGLVQLEKVLRDEVKALEVQKEEQMKEVRRLRKEDEDLCAKLQTEPFYVSLKVIPTPGQVKGLQEHVRDMTILKAKRFAKFSEAKLAIIGFLEQLEDEPNSSFERLVVCEEDDCFTLSSSNIDAVESYLQKLERQVETNKETSETMRKRIFSLMDKLQIDPTEKQKIKEAFGGHSPADMKELKKRLDELETLKCEKMEQFINATREELISYWDLCYYSQAQRDKFTHFYSNEYNESLLEVHEKEVEAIKKYFDDNESLFKKVAKRQDLWKTMLELEAKQKDPDRLLKAKHTELQQEERDRKKVNKRLPIVDEELRALTANYLQAHRTPFLVGGKPYDDFVEEQEDNFRRQQEAERENKVRQRKVANFHETLYGSKPVTPAKRNAKRKAGATPSTVGLDPKRQRPGTMTTFGSATLLRSPFSKFSSTRTAAMNKSKYGLRQQPPRRKILGDYNASVFVAGNAPQPNEGIAGTSMWSVDTDNFVRDLPNSALTSTMQETPESVKKSKRLMNRTPAASTTKPTPLFKTPSSRVLTPANKSVKKLALSNIRKMPFLI